MAHRHTRHFARKASASAAHELPVQLEHYIVQYTQEGLSESSGNIKGLVSDANKGPSKGSPLPVQIEGELIHFTQQALKPVISEVEKWYEEFREIQGAPSHNTSMTRRDSTIQGTLEDDLKASFKPVVSNVEAWYGNFSKTHGSNAALKPADIKINDKPLETYVKDNAADSMKNAVSDLVSRAMRGSFAEVLQPKLIKRAASTTSARERSTASRSRQRESQRERASQRSRASERSRERAQERTSSRADSRSSQTQRASTSSSARSTGRENAAATGASSSVASVPNTTTVPVVTVTATPSNSQANANSVHAQNSKSSLSSGAIAGIVVGAVVGAILLCALLFLALRKKKNNSDAYADGLYDDPSNPAYYYESKAPKKQHRRGGPEPSLFGSFTGPIVDDVDGYEASSRGATPNVPHYADISGSSQSTFDEKNSSFVNPKPQGKVAPVALPSFEKATNPQATTAVQFSQPPPSNAKAFNSMAPAPQPYDPGHGFESQAAPHEAAQNVTGRALSATRGPVPMPAPGDPASHADAPEDTYIIVRTFEPNMPDELHVQPGDRVQLFTTYDDGWALGIDIDAPSPMKGVFPCDCIAIDEDTDYMRLLTSQRRSSIAR